MGSDGMTIDVNGNIYLTGKGVSIFDRMATLLAIFRFLKTGLQTSVLEEKI